MGSNRVESDIILAEVNFGDDDDAADDKDSLIPTSQQIHRKYRRKKGDIDGIANRGGNISNATTTVVLTNGDADIVTPYQNGHQHNHHHHHYNEYPQQRSRLSQRHSSVSGLEDLAEDEEEEGSGRNSQHSQKFKGVTTYGDYLSPPPPPALQHLLLEESSSVNNAITVAPSRNNLNDSNVFAGGRPSNNNLAKRSNHHHRNNRHNNNNNKHSKGRSRTPDFTSSSNHRLRLEEPHDSQSILNRIDLSIRKKFGDWDTGDEGVGSINGAVTNSLPNNVCAPAKQQRVPFYIPKAMVSDTGDGGGLTVANDLNLPRLFKPYESEVAITRKVLNDKTYKVALSRDNDDPNSILSQAKKTLSFVGGGQS